MKFANLKIGTRLSAGFAALLLVMGGMTVSGVVELQTIGLATNTLTHETLGKERLATDWYTHTLTNSVRAMSVFEMHDPEAVKRIKADMAETTKAIDANQEKMKALLVSDGEKAVFEKVLAARKVYSASRKLAMTLTDEGKKEEAAVVINEQMLPALKTYVASIEAVKTMAQSAIDQNAAAIEASYKGGRQLLIGLGLAGLFIGALFAWRLSKGITGPIKEAVDVARTVAAGDLTRHIVVDSKDETGILLQALKEMNESLRNTVTSVRNGTASMQLAATEIATGNQDLSARTESQAGSLEETAAAIEELTSTVKLNAEHANEANRLANDASKVAHQGGTVVTEVIDVMQAIEQSSKKIVDIIAVIDGIAFQTNILALNAAVEAARAGEQGRGFAVVASEVRALAQRSAAAAKEIKGLIGESVSKVTSGAQLVNSAGATMQEIVSSIAQVTTIVNEIAASSREQSIGIEQVNAAVVQMDGMTQQNAALVEEASAAAMELQQQSTSLNQLVVEFKV